MSKHVKTPKPKEASTPWYYSRSQFAILDTEGRPVPFTSQVQQRIVRAVNNHTTLVETLGAAPIIYIDEPTGQIMPGFSAKYTAWLNTVHAALTQAEE